MDKHYSSIGATSRVCCWEEVSVGQCMFKHNMIFFNPVVKGFCQVKKIQKIREKLGSGWVGQAPNRIWFFL